MRSIMSWRRSRCLASRCRNVSRSRMAMPPHDPTRRLRAEILRSLAPWGVMRDGRRCRFLALAIEAEWRKRAAGVVPAQPKARPGGQRHQQCLLSQIMCIHPAGAALREVTQTVDHSAYGQSYSQCLREARDRREPKPNDHILSETVQVERRINKR